MNKQLHDSGQMKPFDWLSEILVTITIVCFIKTIDIYLINKVIIVVFLVAYDHWRAYTWLNPLHTTKALGTTTKWISKRKCKRLWKKFFKTFKLWKITEFSYPTSSGVIFFLDAATEGNEYKGAVYPRRRKLPPRVMPALVRPGLWIIHVKCCLFSPKNAVRGFTLWTWFTASGASVI